MLLLERGREEGLVLLEEGSGEDGLVLLEARSGEDGLVFLDERGGEAGLVFLEERGETYESRPLLGESRLDLCCDVESPPAGLFPDEGLE